MDQGKVWLVGAGPGDPGLFTLKGKYLLEHADVVVYDRLVGAGILSMIPPSAQQINVGKNAGHHPVEQEKISQILLREAQQGKRVVRLKGGDPFIFGRGGEELELLTKHDIPFEVVPGISAAAAVPAYAGIPVTHREYCSSLHIITAHRKRGDDSLPDFETLAKLHGTLVFFMGVSSLPEICAGLIHAGMAEQTPAAVIENGTTARQRSIVSDLKHLPKRAVQAKVQSPALILVGEVCALSAQFSWTEFRPLQFRPLHGCRVLVTRPRERASSLAEKLSALGAEVVLLPSISTKLLLEDNEALSNAIKSLPGYRWVVFTSAAGAEGFFKGLRRFGIDSRNLPFLQFAAIGPATAKAALQFGGILCDYLPEEYTGKALGEGLANICKPDERLLIPRSKIGTDELLKPLRQAGLSFTDVPVYDTVSEPLPNIPVTPQDIFAFTSASTVRGVTERIPKEQYHGMTALCIGEQTAHEAQAHGMKTIQAAESTIDGMIDALLRFHQHQERN